MAHNLLTLLPFNALCSSKLKSIPKQRVRNVFSASKLVYMHHEIFFPNMNFIHTLKPKKKENNKTKLILHRQNVL